MTAQTAKCGTLAEPEVRSAALLSSRQLSALGLVLVIFAFWMLHHPYEGVVHDSILYVFGALARLNPSSLAHDIYLTLGVQDRYTIFSPLAAGVFQLLGPERGAAAITFIAQLAFFVGGWRLARRLMPASLALLSLGLLVVLPPVYGDAHIFSYAEAFMTARLPSEAVVIMALIAVLDGRQLLAAACLIFAALLHPIIAMAGAAIWALFSIGQSRPRLVILVASAGFALLVLVAWVAPFGPVARFDAGWFNLLYTRGAYLFPSRWAPADWAHASVPLATLAIGALTSRAPRIRSLCIAALALGLSGLAISLVGSDLLRIVLVAQAQPWRWLWLSNALAVVMIPAITKECWTQGNTRRAALILLGAAWVCIDEPYAPAIDLLAGAVILGERFVADPRRARLVLMGAWLTLGLSLLALAGYVLHVDRQLALIPPDTSLYDSPYLLALRHWKLWQAGGVLPASIVVGAWWMARRFEGLPGALAVLALGLALCAAFAHLAFNAWTRIDLPSSLLAEFAPWRAAIPPSAQVLWADDVFPTWFVLERPSYWSRSQTSASVYSEAMARELARRQWVILAIRNSIQDPRKRMIETCRSNRGLGYYVSVLDAGPTPFPAIRDPKGPGSLRLYRCADYRS